MTSIRTTLSKAHAAPRVFLPLQKNYNSTTDLHNLGTLKIEETKPTFQPRYAPYSNISQSLAKTDPVRTMRPKFMVFHHDKFCICPTMNGGPPVVFQDDKFCGRPTFWNGGLIQFFQIGALVVQVQDGVVGDAVGGHAPRAHLAHADAMSVAATGEDHLKNIAVGVALEVDGKIG